MRAYARRRPRRTAPDGEGRALPLINVVLLLLVFFMVAGRMTPPPPLAVTPPTAAQGARAPVPPGEIWLASDGGVADSLGAGPFALVAQRTAAAARDGDAVLVRADAQAPTSALTALLQALAQAGAPAVRLATVRP